MDCFDVRPGDWRIGAAWHSMSGMFALEEDISAQVTLPKFIMSVWPVFSDEIQPAGYPDPIKGSSQVSFSEPEKESSHYARTAIVLRISSIGGGLWALLISIHSRLLPASVQSASFRGRLETTGVFSVCVVWEKANQLPFCGKMISGNIVVRKIE